MKTKIISIILAICMLATLCACAGSTDATGSATENADGANTEGVLEASVLSSHGASADCESYSELFEQSDVGNIYITIDEDSLQDMFDNAMDEEYHEADITVNGVTLTDVGIRTKGASSLMSVANSDSDRYGFKIKTDEYVDDQTLCGLDMFVLNASFSDPSYMREYLTYAAAAEMGLTTPYVSYTNVYMNDELFGFYLIIEAYDDAFVERNTDDEDAVLYKADAENCTLGTNDSGDGFEVKYGDDEDNSNIDTLIEVLNSTTSENKAELEEILDVDSVLKNIALNTVMGNYDSYSGSKAHNYYLMYSDGQFEYIGWDYNMSMGGFSEDEGASVNVEVSEPYYATQSSERPLFETLLEIDEYYERYIGYVEDLAEYLADFEETVANLSDVISLYVESDPTAYYTYEDYLKNISETGADLTLLEAKQGMSGMRPQMAGGEMPQMANGEMPQMAEGEMPQMAEGEMPQMTDGEMPQMANGEMPQMANGEMPQMANGEMPQMADGEMPQMADGEMPQMTDGEMPQMTDGEMPQMTDGEMADSPRGGNRGAMFGGELNKETVSIVDYITQRLEVIASQLNG